MFTKMNNITDSEKTTEKKPMVSAPVSSPRRKEQQLRAEVHGAERDGAERCRESRVALSGAGSLSARTSPLQTGNTASRGCQ